MNKQPSWQKQLIDSDINLTDLLEKLELKATDFYDRPIDSILFKLKAPASFINKIKKGCIHDPLLRQILPTESELVKSSNFTQDPLSEKKFNPTSGLLHKFNSRVLLTMTGNCAINCRYCFRQNFPYHDNLPNSQNLQSIRDYIQNNPNITEVILSGGDPLIHNDSYLAKMLSVLESIPSLKTIRFHTRIPIVLPDRITNEFLSLLTNIKKKIVLVVHCNHKQELANDNIKAIRKLADLNITLLNQSVLLKGVNDDPFILAKLSEDLFAAGILPYYLHMLDPVQGSLRFHLDDSTAQNIYYKLQELLPGYLVPKLVREVPNAKAKKLIL